MCSICSPSHGDVFSAIIWTNSRWALWASADTRSAIPKADVSTSNRGKKENAA